MTLKSAKCMTNTEKRVLEMDRNRKDLATSLTSSEWEEEEEVVEVDNKPERLNHLFIRLMLHWRICTMAKISSSP